MIEEIFKLISTHPTGLLIFVPQEDKEEAKEPIFFSSSSGGKFTCRTFFELEENQKDVLKNMIENFKLNYGLKTVPEAEITNAAKTLIRAFGEEKNSEVYNILDFQPRKKHDRSKAS